MEIEGNLIKKSRKILLLDYLNENRSYLISVLGKDINLPPILVKSVEEKDFEEIWKLRECDPFYKDFLELLIEYGDRKEDEHNDDLREYQYLRYLLSSKSECEPIVAFVSDLNLNQYSNKIITSPAIYVKNKEHDNVNLDFGILYCLIKAQIYYSMSRTDILSLAKYKGIDSILYSAMALKVMKDSEFETLMEHQISARLIKSNRLSGSWAIPIDLLILSSYDKCTLDYILDDDIIRKVFFGEDIDEKKWLGKVNAKFRDDYFYLKSICQ